MEKSRKRAVAKAGDVLRRLMNYDRSNSRKQGHVDLMLYNAYELDRNVVQVSGSCGPQSARAQFIVDAQTSSSADCHENTGQQGK